MNSNGVFALVLSLAVFGVLYHDYTVYTHDPRLSQTAAVLAQTTASAPGYDQAAADKMCPPVTKDVACYFDQAKTDPVCVPTQGSCLTAPPVTNIGPVIGMNAIAQEASAVLAAAGCPNPKDKSIKNLTKTICSAKDTTGKMVLSGHCVYANKCHTDWVLVNGQWTRPKQYVASGGGGVPIPSTTTQPPALPNAGTNVNTPATPATQPPAVNQPPAPAPEKPAAPVVPAAGSSPVPPAQTTAPALPPPVNNAISGSNNPPAIGSGAVPAQPFTGNPALGNSVGAQPVAGAGPAGGTPVPTTGAIPQPKSTFGGTPYTSSRTSSSFSQSVSSFVSSINPIQLFTGVVNIATSIISSVTNRESPPTQVIVQQPPRVVVVNRGGSGAGSAPQVYVNVNGSPVAMPPSVNKATSLLQQGLFVQLYDTALGTGSDMSAVISGLASTTSREGKGSSSGSPKKPGVISNPGTVTNPGETPPTTPAGSGAGGPPPTLDTSSQDDLSLSHLSNFGIPGSLINVSTSSTAEGFSYMGPVAVSAGGPTDVGKSWGLLVSTLRGNLSGTDVSTESPLSQSQAALAQTLSNYEGVRAQIQELQDAKDAGVCDLVCEHSYDELVLQLPLQRAAVNALNNIIDQQITDISHKSFTEGLPMVNIEKTGIPVPEPSVSSDNLTPDLSGLAIAPDINVHVFDGEGISQIVSDENIAGIPSGEGSVPGTVGGGVGTSTPATKVAHDPFKKPIFVLDDPYLFTPATGTGAGTSSEYQSLSGSSPVVQQAAIAWHQVTGWVTQVFARDTTKPCSLLYSLFGMCNK